ncbi:MAG: AbrB/MazE/SpoVT family DNA-binding domain-containing protein, partial [Rhabdochlamydiaceae bacterium]
MLKLQKENKRKKENTGNMAVKPFFGKNKEIFTHGLFVDIRFPYLFLLLSLCSRFQTFVQYDIPAKKTLWFLMSKPYGFFRLLWMISFGTMTQKIYARSVMKMGHEPQHSLMVTIPRKICTELQIGKGTNLYFKLEGNRFVVSKDTKFL